MLQERGLRGKCEILHTVCIANRGESTSSGAKNETTLMAEEPTLPVNNFILVIYRK